MKKIVVLLLAGLLLLIPIAKAKDISFENLVLDVIKENPEVIKETLAKYEQELAKKEKEKEFEKLLSNRAEVNIGETPIRGNKKAKYTVVAFSDFQCPFCKRGDDTVKQLIKKHGNDVSYVFKHFPLGFHKNARPASKACYAAGEQGKYYEYHDKLFENQSKLGEELYLQIAKELGLNVDKFNKDRESEAAEKQINADMEAGKAVGIRGTPGFLVNGVKVFGAYPLDHFEKILTALDQEKSKK